MRLQAKLIYLLLIFFSFSAYSSETYFCNDEMGKLPIQQNGRTKPLLVHANKMVKSLTGSTKVGDYSSVMAYCLLSLEGLTLKNDLVLTAKIEHVKVRELLEIEEGKKGISFKELLPQSPKIRRALMPIKENNSYKKALVKLFNQLSVYKDITNGSNWLIPEYQGNDKFVWLPITSFLSPEKLKGTGLKNKNAFSKVLEKANETYQQKNGDTHILEYKYSKLNLPGLNFLFTFLALALLVLFKKTKAAHVVAYITIISQVIYIILRIMISGRAPITNMYETVMFSGFGALVLALIIGTLKKDKTYLYMGLCYNVMTLFMMNFSGGLLDEEISPLVPVLRDNFWLSTHVTCIIISYGALALSWVLANTVLIKKRFSVLTPADEKYYTNQIYVCLKYGTTLLSAGVILGGVWADYSWGRFWGWDPKETWSLIVLCIYIAILHGKYTNWIPVHRFSQLVAVAFLSVMMAWFGVNYILASGLHSYGFSEGGAVFLGGFFLTQFIILGITWKSFSNNSTGAFA
ncbi:MAG: cytochrome c biogenesis protein CcsA [Halobacteriovoraceae bacterium]|jgi:cytochrome c-type biogenesis protein CcsB|nr:cytochrome c biogenesis protein CcsA [Halobacteriovoraceae bacterium]